MPRTERWPLFAVSKTRFGDQRLSDPSGIFRGRTALPLLLEWSPKRKGMETAQASDQTDQKCQEQGSVRPTGVHPNGVTPL